MNDLVRRVFGSRVCFAALIGIVSLTAPSMATAATPDHIYEVGPGIPLAYRYFVQVMGAETETAARAWFECVRETQPAQSVALYKIPAPSGFRPENPFAIVVASYATGTEADHVLSKVLSEFRYEAVAQCLKIPQSDITNAISRFRDSTFKFALNVPQNGWQKHIARSPLRTFSGIGDIRVRNDGVPRRSLVEGRFYASAQSVAAAIASFRGRYPDIQFAAIRHGDRYFVSVTSLVGDGGLDVAAHAMRARGAYRLAVRATFMGAETKFITDSTVSFLDLDGNPLPTLPGTTQLGQRLSTYVLEPADLFEPTPGRIRRCLSGKKYSDAAKLRELASCTGVVLTESSLTRCLAESDCQGMRVPIGFAERPDHLVRTCLRLGIPGEGGGDGQPIPWRDPVTACQATILDPTFLSIVDKIGLQACLASIGAPPPITGSPSSETTQCQSARTALRLVCNDPKNKALCDAEPDIVQEVQRRAEAIESCLIRQNCGLIVPRPPAIEALVEREVQRLGMTIGQTLSVSKAAFGRLTMATENVASGFKECIGYRDTGDQRKATECFLSLGLNVEEGKLLQCMNGAADSAARSACIDSQLGSSWSSTVARAECAKNAAGDLSAIAACIGDDASALGAAYQCATGKSSVADVALICVKGVPPDVAKSLACARRKTDVGGYISCLPNLGEREKAAVCLANAETEAERVGCVASVMKMDPKLASTVGCLVQANGEASAMAACAIAPNLPPEVAKAANCAASTSGATDFALCAGGSNLNPELRIAAECAVSTGGEPISFSSCTAGRLTARELGKCLSGEIGKEGGCFGPNNDLVKAFNTQMNDILHGPGPNNDIVKAFAPLASAITGIGRGVSSALQRTADDFKRGDIGRTICGWLGC